MTNEYHKDVKRFQDRYIAHVSPDSTDISLRVLKGHLLAKELLIDYISKNIAHSEHIELGKSYWSFINKLELASAISDDQYHDNWVWTSLKKLNSVRNGLSHRLQTKELYKMISGVEASVLVYQKVFNNIKVFMGMYFFQLQACLLQSKLRRVKYKTFDKNYK